MSRAKREEHALRPPGLDDTWTRWHEPSSEELLDRSNTLSSAYTLRAPASVRRQWVRVCLFARSAIDAGHWVPPGLDAFSTNEMSKTLAMYGVALAHLQRFYEAHRRLNHAHALLMDAGRAAPLVQLGILELRRAEAYVLEAELARTLAFVIRKQTLKGFVVRFAEERQFDKIPGIIADGFRASSVPDERHRPIWMWLHSQLRRFCTVDPIASRESGAMDERVGLPSRRSGTFSKGGDALDDVESTQGE